MCTKFLLSLTILILSNSLYAMDNGQKKNELSTKNLTETLPEGWEKEWVVDDNIEDILDDGDGIFPSASAPSSNGNAGECSNSSTKAPSSITVDNANSKIDTAQHAAQQNEKKVEIKKQESSSKTTKEIEKMDLTGFFVYMLSNPLDVFKE